MYNKLFTRILDSSVWLESIETRIVWITMLAAMDKDGFVEFATIGNLAQRARVSLADATTAVEILEAPDKHSSDPEFKGRRIERIDGGWIVLNSYKYRGIITSEHKREMNARRVAKCRERKRLKKSKPSGLETEFVKAEKDGESVEVTDAIAATRVHRSGGELNQEE